MDKETLEKYAPNVLKRIPEDVLKKFEIDGKIYGIPYDIVSDSTSQPDADEETLKYINDNFVAKASDENLGLWIRDDIAKMIYPDVKSWDDIEKEVNENHQPIADELFDIPVNTTEEYIDFMYKIKALNLKENGKDVYSFGYSGGDNWEALVHLGGDMMGYAPHYYTSSWNPVTKKIRLPLVEDIVKEAAKNQNKMVIDKVIDPESLMHTTNMYKEKVLNGQYAICAISYAGGAEEVNKSLAAAGKSFRYRPFYSSVPNKEEYAPGKTSRYWNQAVTFTKTLSESELKQMLNWLNVQFSDEFEEVYAWGSKEADLYVENEDGTRSFKDERFNKRFIEGDVSAVSDEECKGLLDTYVGEWYCYPTNVNRWRPIVYNRANVMRPYTAVKTFKEDSPHLDIPEYPSYQVWDPAFANIDEVVTYWSKREQWENAFKLSLAAQNESEFETKWKEAVDNLNGIVNVNTMCEKMTEAALSNQ